jgi:adenylate cyclase
MGRTIGRTIGRRKAQNWFWRYRGIFLIAPLVTGIILVMRTIGWLQPLELAQLDGLFRLRPTPMRDPRIVIVVVTEADLRQLGQWPMNDRVLAQVLTNIRQAEPLAIGLDIYRNIPVPPGTDSLAQVFRTTPNLIGIEKRWQTDLAAPEIPAPDILSAAEQVGINDLMVDSDGRLRRGLLYLPTATTTYPSLGLSLALIYLEAMGIQPNPEANLLELREVTFPPWDANDGGYVRADDGGYQVMLNYRGGSGSFDQVSLTDVQRNLVSPDRFKNRIVLIGAAATSLKDSFLTPYSQDSPQTGPVPTLQTPGVEIHANVVSHILGAVLDRRPQIHTWSDSIEALWIAVWGFAGTSLAWRSRFYDRQLPRKIGGFGLIAAGLGLGSYFAFWWGWWLPLIPALFAYLMGIMAVTIDTAQQAGKIRRTFGRYLSDEVVNQLLESPQGSQLGGERRNITMLLSDLRGFSAIAEQYPPELVITFLNQYLALMTEVITTYKGTIDEFMGDGILVLFGAPIAREDDADRALACALAMQLAMPRLIERLERLDRPMQAVAEYLEMGIAIHTGEVVVGNIGSLKRAKYGIVGSNINLVSRIESHTVGQQILISAATRDAVLTSIGVQTVPAFQAKGFADPITIYDLQSIAGKYNLTLPDRDQPLLKLTDPIVVQCVVLDEKQIKTPPVLGTITHISRSHAQLQINQTLTTYTDVKLNWRSTDCYAKVIEVIPPELLTGVPSYYLRLTFLPPGLRAIVANLSTP